MRTALCENLPFLFYVTVSINLPYTCQHTAGSQQVTERFDTFVRQFFVVVAAVTA